MRLEAADELPGRTHINEAPGAVGFVHGIFVGLAEETNGADFGLGKIVEVGGETAVFAVEEFDGVDVLLAAPDHFLFFFAFAVGDDAEGGGHGGNEEDGGEENGKQEGVAALGAISAAN